MLAPTLFSPSSCSDWRSATFPGLRQREIRRCCREGPTALWSCIPPSRPPRLGSIQELPATVQTQRPVLFQQHRLHPPRSRRTEPELTDSPKRRNQALRAQDVGGNARRSHGPRARTPPAYTDVRGRSAIDTGGAVSASPFRSHGFANGAVEVSSRRAPRAPAASQRDEALADHKLFVMSQQPAA